MTSSLTVTALYRPDALCSSRSRPATVQPLLASRRRGAFVINARNFKTRDTEKEIQKNTPSTDELNDKVNDYFNNLKAKWDETEEKPAVVAAGVSGFVVIWAVSGLVDRLDRLPLIGGFLELIGLLVTGWFTYRYLTFAPDREELKKSVDSFYQKVTGKKNW